MKGYPTKKRGFINRVGGRDEIQSIRQTSHGACDVLALRISRTPRLVMREEVQVDV